MIQPERRCRKIAISPDSWNTHRYPGEPREYSIALRKTLLHLATFLLDGCERLLPQLGEKCRRDDSALMGVDVDCMCHAKAEQRLVCHASSGHIVDRMDVTRSRTRYHSNSLARVLSGDRSLHHSLLAMAKSRTDLRPRSRDASFSERDHPAQLNRVIGSVCCPVLGDMGERSVPRFALK